MNAELKSGLKPQHSTQRPGPLSGLKVVDLSTVFAVPYTASLLGDLGAEIIKIEAPDRLEQTRGVVFGPLLDNEARDNPWDFSGSFQVLNRNKRSLVLNLRTEEGREVLWMLIEQADILLDNFTPRVLHGWDMSPQKIAERNPRLIHLSNTGFGSSGPWKNFKAQGTTLEYTMGVGAYSGYAGGGPSKVGQSYPDFLAAWTALTALMAALIERRSTGFGQWIDVGMYQLGAAAIPEAVIAAQFGETLQRVGSIDRWVAISGVFETADADRWVTVSAEQSQWLKLLEHLPDLDADSEPTEVLREWISTYSSEEVLALLDELSIPAGLVSDSRDLFLDEQLNARKFYEDADTPDDSDRRPLIGRPYNWQGPTGVRIRRRAPRFGEHNDEVLAEVGINQDHVAAMRQQGSWLIRRSMLHRLFLKI